MKNIKEEESPLVQIIKRNKSPKDRSTQRSGFKDLTGMRKGMRTLYNHLLKRGCIL